MRTFYTLRAGVQLKAGLPGDDGGGVLAGGAERGGDRRGASGGHRHGGHEASLKDSLSRGQSDVTFAIRRPGFCEELLGWNPRGSGIYGGGSADSGSTGSRISGEPISGGAPHPGASRRPDWTRPDWTGRTSPVRRCGGLAGGGKSLHWPDLGPQPGRHPLPRSRPAPFGPSVLRRSGDRLRRRPMQGTDLCDSPSRRVLRGADLEGSMAARATLTGSDLSFTSPGGGLSFRYDLSGCRLHGADLFHVGLQRGELFQGGDLHPGRLQVSGTVVTRSLLPLHRHRVNHVHHHAESALDRRTPGPGTNDWPPVLPGARTGSGNPLMGDPGGSTPSVPPSPLLPGASRMMSINLDSERLRKRRSRSPFSRNLLHKTLMHPVGPGGSPPPPQEKPPPPPFFSPPGAPPTSPRS